MAAKPPGDSLPPGAAGDYAEVVDTSNELHGNIGVVAFFVGDNVYVTFPDVRRSPTKMFFLEQLRAVTAPQHQRRLAVGPAWLKKLHLSMLKLRP